MNSVNGDELVLWAVSPSEWRVCVLVNLTSVDVDLSENTSFSHTIHLYSHPFFHRQLFLKTIFA